MGYLDLSDKQAAPGKSIRATVDGLRISVEYENDQRNLDLGKIERVTMHWSVGPYAMAFDGYHYNIVFDEGKKKAHVVKTLKVGQYGRHAFKANKHNIGVGFAAMMKTDPDTLQGKCPITAEMLTVGACFVAEFMAWHGLDPRTNALTDHRRVDVEVGRAQKTDIGRYFDSFKIEVIKHYDLLKAGKAKFAYKAILVD